jgi:hypothetical protein
MKTIAAITVLEVAAFFASVSLNTPAEAKKFKPPHVGKNVGKAARNAGKSVSRAARWGANGIWIGTGIGAGYATVTSNCNYYYKRYRETGDRKWRNKYNACI